jgi:hypothetical protein
MVTEHIEDGFEFSQVFSEKFYQTGVLGVANVPEQRKVLCRWSNFKDIVRRWSLQMKIRKNLYLYHACGGKTLLELKFVGLCT